MYVQQCLGKRLKINAYLGLFSRTCLKSHSSKYLALMRRVVASKVFLAKRRGAEVLTAKLTTDMKNIAFETVK